MILAALVFGPFLYQRVNVILSLKDNAPGKLQSRSALSSYQIKFADQLRNCEDVILPEGLPGLALLSCDEARDRWNTVMVSLSDIMRITATVLREVETSPTRCKAYTLSS